MPPLHLTSTVRHTIAQRHNDIHVIICPSPSCPLPTDSHKHTLGIQLTGMLLHSSLSSRFLEGFLNQKFNWHSVRIVLFGLFHLFTSSWSEMMVAAVSKLFGGHQVWEGIYIHLMGERAREMCSPILTCSAPSAGQCDELNSHMAWQVEDMRSDSMGYTLWCKVGYLHTFSSSLSSVNQLD